MTHNKKQTIPTAIPVEELADQMAITPNELRLAIGLAAAVRQPRSNVDSVLRMDPRVNSRAQDGRWFYFIEEAA